MADNEGQATKYCSNCKRHIAAVNFVMHDVHCHKNIVLCKKCKEPVARSDLEEHDAEEHALVSCDLCKAACEKSALDEHKLSCPKRPAVCPFCELDCVHDTLESHMDYCGTRTEPCELCTQFIMYKDLERHRDSNCTYPPPKAQTAAPTSTALENQYRGGDLYYGGSSSTMPNGVPLNMNSFVRGELGRLDRHPGEQSHDQYSADSRRNVFHRGQGQRDIEDRNLSRPRKITNSNRGGTRGGRASQAKKKVPNVRKTIPDYRIVDTPDLENASATSGMDHALALQLAGLDLSGDLGLTEDDLQDHLMAERLSSGGAVTQGSTESRDSSGRADTVMLPCENCSEKFPLSQLLDHQNQCTDSDIHASPDPHSSAVNHSPSLALNNNGGGVSPVGVRGHPALINNLNGHSEHSQFASGPLNHSGDTSEVWFPCEFCEESFPEDILWQHQPVCDRNPYKTPRSMTPKVNYRSVDPLHQASNPTIQRSRFSSPAVAQARGPKKVPNTSTTPEQRRNYKTSKVNHTLDEFRTNPSYSPLDLRGNQNENRASPTGPSSRGNRGGGYRGNTATSYKPSFGSGGAMGSNMQTKSTRPRLVPRTNYDASELGASGASVRTNTTMNNQSNSTRGKRIKKPQREV